MFYLFLNTKYWQSKGTRSWLSVTLHIMIILYYLFYLSRQDHLFDKTNWQSYFRQKLFRQKAFSTGSYFRQHVFDKIIFSTKSFSNCSFSKKIVFRQVIFVAGHIFWIGKASLYHSIDNPYLVFQERQREREEVERQRIAELQGPYSQTILRKLN